MAGDWIKIRLGLARDPKVLTITDYLSRNRVFMDWLSDPVRRTCERTAYEVVAREVLVPLTVHGLVQVWGVAREDGHRHGDDLILHHANLETLDGIAGFPGLGEAMYNVGWASCDKDNTVTFPKFFVRNSDTEELRKQRDRDRKRQSRCKQPTPVRGSVRGRSATVTGKSPPREEKRRDKKKPQKVSSAAPADGAASQPEKEPQAEAKQGTPNPVWDAVCEVFGLKPVTEAERKRVGRIVRDLKAKEAAPEEVAQRLARYRQEWPNAARTPEALLKHWDAFGPAQTAAGTETPAQRDARILAQRQKAEQERQAAAKGLSFSDLSKEAGDASQ